MRTSYVSYDSTEWIKGGTHLCELSVSAHFLSMKDLRHGLYCLLSTMENPSLWVISLPGHQGKLTDKCQEWRSLLPVHLGLGERLWFHLDGDNPLARRMRNPNMV